MQYFKNIMLGMLICLVAVCANISYAANNPSLQKVTYTPLPQNRLRIDLFFNKDIQKPKSFITQNPSRLIVDLIGVSNGLTSAQNNKTINIGVAEKFRALQSEKRTRVVVDLKEVVKYQLALKGRRVQIVLAGGHRGTKSLGMERFVPVKSAYAAHQIKNIDFTATPQHGGKIIVAISDPDMGIDIQQRENSIVVDFIDTALPGRLIRRLDVRDFGTPVQNVDVKRRGHNARLVIKNIGHFEHFAYQVNNRFIIDILPMSNKKRAQAKLKKQVYTGKRISLNFQNIKVRAVLQLLADFTSTNMVISDGVVGDITLRLNNVPWDQALAIILKTRSLDKRQFGSVLLVAPAEEIAAREKQELEAQKQVEELAPLRSELIQVNYAKAEAIAVLLKEKGNSLLSPRGNVSVDTRTNTLWIQDIPYQLAEIRELIKKLDVPVKQVLIEARVVIVDRDFERDLGIQWGITKPNHLSGTLEGANKIVGGTPPAEVPVAERLNISLPAIPVSGSPATIGLALAKLGDNVLLDLELSALESEGRGEVISSPRVITANQQSAMIESGEEIPYQEATSSGATSIAFKKAVLGLKVTPQITPDAKIILELQVNQDTPSTQTFQGVPAIQTKEIQTNVLVDNGQTIVLGGIYRQSKTSDVTRVPFLGTLPYLGYLFRRKQNLAQREELLIFVTPKIIQEGYAG